MNRRYVRVIAAIAATALLGGALAACGDEDEGGDATAGGAAAKSEHFTIGWVPPTVAPFEAAMRKGIEVQAKKLGMDLVVAGGQFDPKVQLTAIDTLIGRGVDAIVIWPVDEKAIAPAFDKAREKGIPIVTIDAPLAKGDVNFQTNDEEATAALAGFVAEQVGKPCKVAIIEGVSAVSILAARNSGYASGAEAAGCEVVDKQTNSNDTPEKAGEIVRTWKTRFGDDLNGILAINDPSALAASALADDKFKPVIVGLNGDSANIEAIEQGRVAGTASLLSPEIGNGMAYAAYQLLTKKPVPATVAVKYAQLTKENISSYEPYEARLKAPLGVSFANDELAATPGS